MISKRISLIALLLLVVNTFAQEVVKVYPQYAVVGEEAIFTAVGSNFLTSSKIGRGMKFSTLPVPCHKPHKVYKTTVKRYSFACTFSSAHPVVDLKIFAVPKPKQMTMIWQGNLQVFSGRPVVQYVAISGSTYSGQSNVLCRPGMPCIISSGVVAPYEPTQIEVGGTNLPKSLNLTIVGCDVVPTEDMNTERKIFTCTPGQKRIGPIAIQTARPNEGGVKLFKGNIDL